MEVVVSLFLGTEGMKKGTKYKHVRISWGNSPLHFLFHYTVTQMMFTKINLAMTTDEDKS